DVRHWPTRRQLAESCATSHRARSAEAVGAGASRQTLLALFPRQRYRVRSAEEYLYDAVWHRPVPAHPRRGRHHRRLMSRTVHPHAHASGALAGHAEGMAGGWADDQQADADLRALAADLRNLHDVRPLGLAAAVDSHQPGVAHRD